MATMNLIASWAKGVIEGVTGYNKVWSHVRRVRNDEQLSEDFGTGANDEDAVEIMKGWMITVQGPAERGAPNIGSVVSEYTLDALCTWTIYNRGASEEAFRDHVEAVTAALSGVEEPVALTSALPVTSKLNKVFVANVVEGPLVVLWPPGLARLAHRATVRQVIRIREQVR